MGNNLVLESDAKGEKSPLCINDVLCTMIFEKIFDYLDTQDLLSCMRVCKCWNNLINDCIGIPLHIGKRNRYIWRQYQGAPFQLVSAMKQYTSRKAFISEFGNQIIPSNQLCNFWKTPNLVQYLWIDGYIPQGSLNNVLKDLFSLRKLSIHFNTLAALNPGDFSTLPLKSLINLNTFKISLDDSVLIVHRCHSIGNGLLNAIELFETGCKLPKLVTLKLSFPWCINYVPRLCQAIANFMIKHYLTLANFKLDFPHYAESKKLLQTPAGNKIEGVAARLPVMDMKSISIHSIYENNRELNIFQNLIKGQKSLVTLLSLFKFLTQDEIAISIRDSCLTLRNITLAVETRPLDLNVFSSCINLKKLELFGMNQGEEDDNVEPDLVNGALITRNLQVLALTNLYVLTKDIGDILHDQNDLKFLHCVNVGTVNNFGILFDTVYRRFLSERKIQSIYLLNSVNRESVMKEIEAIGSSAVNLVSVLMEQDEANRICIRLNQKNEYIFGQEYNHFKIKYPGGFYPSIPITRFRNKVFEELTDDEVVAARSEDEDED